MGRPGTPRSWIWASLIVWGAGLGYDGIWHGFLNPDFEARTVSEMVNHLATVHLPIYVGVAAVFLSTAWALIDQMKRSKVGVAVPVAFAGALVAAVGEAWHASTHLQLSTRSGPLAAATAFVGVLVVVTALWLEGRQRRGRAAGDVDERRVA